MNEHEYPIPVRQFVKTLIEICRHQDRSDLVEILENSHPRFEQNEEFSDREKETLWKVCKANDQVYNAHNVVQKIYDKIGPPPKTPEEITEESSF